MNELIKGTPDWHLKVNENFNEVSTQLADIESEALLSSCVADSVNFRWQTDSAIMLYGNNQYNKLIVNLDGLYFAGRNLNTGVLKKKQIDTNLLGNIATDLVAGIEKPDTWYAVFLVEDPLDSSVKIKFMPFVRIKVDNTNNTIEFAKHFDKTVLENYGFAVNELVGSKIVVLADGQGGFAPLGALRNIVANTDTQLTYNSNYLGVGSGGWLMLSPPGYESYKYVGAVCNDGSSNFLNFVKHGKTYNSLGYKILTAGTASTSTEVDTNGKVPPTARGLRLRLSALSVNNATAGGGFGCKVSMDGAHLSAEIFSPAQGIVAQQATSSVQDNILMFYPLKIWYEKAGSNASSVDLQVYGYTE